MQLELKPADAERAEGELAVIVFALVGRLDAFDAERGLSVDVGQKLNARVVLPGGRRQKLGADGAGGIDDISVLDSFCAGFVIGRGDALNIDPEPVLERLYRGI